MSTLHYGDQRLAMYVDSIQRADRVTAERVVNEAVRWGLSRGRAVEAVEDLLERAPRAIAEAHGETSGVPAEPLTAI